MAMLYQGKVRQVGTVDEIRHSSDPVVRQFIEGRPSLDDVSLELPAGVDAPGGI
jgi:phospholipid/cholesterol/gamma-HCH transport system ATP-binding protein